MKRFFTTLFFLTLIILVFSIYSSAQDKRAQAAEAYRKGDYKGAINLLKDLVKAKNATADDWYLLGASQLSEEKPKDAEKSFRQVLEIDQRYSRAMVGLGYSYLMRNKNHLARAEADKAIKLNDKDAEAHYIVGVTRFRDQMFSGAYEEAEKAIKLNPNIAASYILKTESLVNSFAKQSGTVLKPTNPRAQLLREATESLEKYFQLVGANKVSDYYKNYLESIRFFADYYKDRDALPNDPYLPPPPVAPNETAIKFLAKPKPSYTDKAREAGVQGTIRLLVGFSTNGKVEYVLAITSLGFGLDESAVKAARQIKFEPPTKDGKPLPTVKTIEYSFAMY